MQQSTQRLTLRLLPVVLLMAAVTAWFNDIQDGGPHVIRNLLPPGLTVLLAWLVLYRGGGRWTGAGWSPLLGTLGFAIPACGLAAYLHYAYSVNLDEMFNDGAGQLFRYLPVYTIGAGGVGFVIGWIIGRNIEWPVR